MRQMLDSAGAGNRYREGAYTITQGHAPRSVIFWVIYLRAQCWNMYI